MNPVLVALIGPLTAIVFAMAQKLFRAGASDAAKEQFSEMIRAELAIFEQRFVERLNGTYKRTGECKLIESENARRMATLETDVKELHQYAHSRSHQLANQMQSFAAKVGA